MSRFKFINTADTIFISVSTFLLLFAWINFYINNFLISMLASGLSAFILLITIRFFKTKSKAKKDAVNNDNLRANIFATNFQLYSESQKLNTIAKFIDKDYEYKIATNHIEIPKIKTFVLIVNNVEKVNISMLLNIIKPYTKKASKIIIFTNDYEEETLKFANTIDINIKLYNKFDFYSLCKLYNVEIKEIIKLKNSKTSYKNIFKNFFSKKHSKGFLFSGIIILLTSFIIPFTNYYIIWGTILIIFAIICRLPKFKEINKNWLE